GWGWAKSGNKSSRQISRGVRVAWGGPSGELRRTCQQSDRWISEAPPFTSYHFSSPPLYTASLSFRTQPKAPKANAPVAVEANEVDTEGRAVQLFRFCGLLQQRRRCFLEHHDDIFCRGVD
ncbi:unnamed protein product, partial [Ectocarpus sp. 13 AM-2016]